LLVAAAGLVGAAFAAEEPTAERRELSLDTFDTAWRIVRDTHFDPDLNGVDWNAVRNELRPAAASAASDEELRGVLSDMVGRLGQSHFAVFAGEAVDRLDSFVEDDEAADDDAAGDAVVGLDLRLLDDRLVVTHVEPGFPADEAGVRPGWMLTQVGEREVAELLELIRTEMADGLYGEAVVVHEVVAEALDGDAGSEVQLRFLDADDAVRELTLVRKAAPGQLVRFGNLPPMLTRVEQRTVTTVDGHRVGVVSLSSWMVPAMAELDRALFDFRDLDGVVFDLRGNPGGVGAMVMGTAGHFIDEKADLGTMRMRSNSLRFAVNPRLVDAAGRRVPVFAGPLAILVDELSASTSEVFAGGMQELGRARIFGSTTMGAVLPAQMERLPNGDVLYHAFAEYTTPSGIALEGRGVLPDEPVALRRSDLLAGRDARLDAALGWIDAEAARTTAPTTGPEQGGQQ
jgi:carboxyl-terminal processing protease